MFLLDTNLVSELRKISHQKANKGVVEWFSQQEIIHAYISVITVMEIQQGILLKQRKDKQQAAIFALWRDSVLRVFDGRILPITTDIALECANFHVPNKSSANDALIGATAKVHNLSVVTRNSKDFDFDGVKVINPFE